jgi:hypothetical protein
VPKVLALPDLQSGTTPGQSGDFRPGRLQPQNLGLAGRRVDRSGEYKQQIAEPIQVG